MTIAQLDIAIVGAGMAGSALACALGQDGWRVALIEAASSVALPVLRDELHNYDARVSALSPASIQWLSQLGVWSDIASRRACAYRRMRVWDGEGSGQIEFDSAALNTAALGAIVENRIMVEALRCRLAQLSNVRCYDDTALVDVKCEQGAQRLYFSGGASLAAGLVVGADGANSFIRRHAGIVTREWDYGHSALVCTVATELPHQQMARQSFLPGGPLAFLPLADSQGRQCFSSIVWSAPPAQVAELKACDEAAFAERLAVAIEQQLGAIRAVGARYSFALRQRHAVDYIRPGLALIADAAHTIHPLAGQGINLGLADARVLAQELLRARQRQLPCHEFSLLQRYQRRRKGHNLAMMVAMEGFKRLFEQPALPWRWLRNSGMRWLDGQARIKQQLAAQAMGLVGDPLPPDFERD